MLVYIFISCKARINQCYDRITNMMKKLDSNNYIIVTGGNEENKYCKDKHLLEIKCNDYYEGLPEKVIKTYEFIYNNEIFNKFTHFCKLDDDMIIKKFINLSIITDYCGKIQNVNGNRRWHINRCSKDSFFNTQPYTGPYVPWCLGGRGYIISRDSLKVLSIDTNYNNEIYEDLYVAKILLNNKIRPTNIPDLSIYIYSPDHH